MRLTSAANFVSKSGQMKLEMDSSSTVKVDSNHETLLCDTCASTTIIFYTLLFSDFSKKERLNLCNGKDPNGHVATFYT